MEEAGDGRKEEAENRDLLATGNKSRGKKKKGKMSLHLKKKTASLCGNWPEGRGKKKSARTRQEHRAG